MAKNMILSMLLLAAIVAAAIISGCVNEPEKSYLRVTNIELVAGEIKTSTIELKATAFIKNIEPDGGKSSKNVTLVLKAISTERDFLVNQTTIFVGKIKPDTEVDVAATLILPKKWGYNLKASLYEEGKELASGSRSVYNLDSLTADNKATGLEIDGIDFLVKDAEKGKVLIKSDVYITNTGGKSSKDYKLMIKATDIDSQLVADKQWSNTGIINPDETAIRSVNLTVPDKYNYVVDVLLWDNSTIVGKGQDYVQLNATTMLTSKQRLTSRGTYAIDFAIEDAPAPAYEAGAAEMGVGAFANETAEMPNKTPGFGVFAGIFAAALGKAVASRRRR